MAGALEALGISVRTAARRLHVTPSELDNVIAAKSPITPEMALRLGALCGNGPELWLSMQQDCDLWHGRVEKSAELDEIKSPSKS